ncbi:WD40 repeat domain-containing protein [Candidatus Dependentiae bacterium]|nr:WD40 repeat domain-containing protein [Candidatus Dependentiae bacterium]
MNYVTRALNLLMFVSSITTGLSVYSMEQLASKSAALLSNEEKQSMLKELWALPQELRDTIGILFLESSLNYNLTCSKVLKGHTQSITFILFSPDGNSALTGSEDDTARLWDVKTGKQLHILKGPISHIISIAFSPDGNTVVTGSNDRTARLWDIKTGQQLKELKGHTTDVKSLAFSPDGNTVITGSEDMTARLWDTKTGQQKHLLEGHTHKVISVAFSPDGNTVVTGSWDNTARLWDVNTGQQLHILQGHTYGITSVAFSPDGTTVLTGSEDYTARLWDVNTAQQLHILQGHTGCINSVAFSPDGNTILTGSKDKTARLWTRLEGSTDFLKTRKETAFDLFMKFCLRINITNNQPIVSCIHDDNTLFTQSDNTIAWLWGSSTENQVYLQKWPIQLMPLVARNCEETQPWWVETEDGTFCLMELDLRNLMEEESNELDM